jgi:hypothetical protein
MGTCYSLDLRERVARFVEAGGSRRAAARQFAVSASCAIKLLRRHARTPRRTMQLRGFGRRFDAARGSDVVGPAFWQADDGRERAQGPIPRLPQAATGRPSIQRKRLRL